MVDDCLYRFFGKCPECLKDEHNLDCPNYRPVRPLIYEVYDFKERAQFNKKRRLEDKTETFK